MVGVVIGVLCIAVPRPRVDTAGDAMDAPRCAGASVLTLAADIGCRGEGVGSHVGAGVEGDARGVVFSFYKSGTVCSVMR